MELGKIDISIDDLKKKFEKLQKGIQGVKEEKIRTESELKTLRGEYDSRLKELMEMTNTTSIEDAIEVYKSRSQSLEDEKSVLEGELNRYLETYESSSLEI